MPLPLGPSVFPDGDPTPLLMLLYVLMLRTSKEKQANSLEEIHLRKFESVNQLCNSSATFAVSLSLFAVSLSL